jgi:hypothetical protein
MLLATGCVGFQMTKIFSLLWIIMDNIVKKSKIVSNEMVTPPGTKGQKRPTEADFPVRTSGTAGYGKTKTKMERPRAP